MKLTLSDTKYIKDSTSIISELVTEARFKVTKEAFELVAMDPANVAMVIFKLFSSSFVEFEVKEEVDIAINLNDLKQVFRRIKPSDTLTLEDADGKLKLTLKGAQKRTFHLPMIDVEAREQKIPELTFSATIVCPAGQLADAIEDMDIVGESVVFEADGKTFEVSSASELTKAQVTMTPDSNTKIVADEKQKAKYSIEYLKKMVAGSKLADNVQVQFSKDYPIKLEYKVLNVMFLAFILAPRVDND
ncbi:proliferating cell nuclear antigen (pcna) [Candidatus Woesearchaeota archaeon]|nr:proliferating cell nuclear antigen (pcna) [Candidatus Woesearchaeota archaeon]